LVSILKPGESTIPAQQMEIMQTISGRLVDLHERRIYPATVSIADGRITRIDPAAPGSVDEGFILPGFVDAHVHIESSMLPPSEFGRLAVAHGTVATVSDPHEIANVLGVPGVLFMMEDAKRTPLKICFGAPSCVPATRFETAGAHLDAADVEKLLRHPDIGYLSEMMNFPGVLHDDPEVMAKIKAAKAVGKPIDGHAPGLRGDEAKQYFAAGITTDHECFTYEEGQEKARLGVKILIREGSAARNFEALWPLIGEFSDRVMFCSDDKHPDDLIQGHINQLAARAIAKGCDLYDVLRAACVNPVEHYRLPVGQMRPGDPADCIRVKDLKDFEVLATWINGRQVAKNGVSALEHLPIDTPNQFLAHEKKPEDFFLQATTNSPLVRVIQAWNGQIVTGHKRGQVKILNGGLQPDPAQDILKIAVVNRYTRDAKPAVGFVQGFGLKKGALASSVAHDSHNIVAVGVDDASLCAAVNAIIRTQGGVGAVDGKGQEHILPLPIAGLMSPEDGYTLAGQYAKIDQWSKTELGCTLRAPFMVLSFLALPVIPALKMTDLGLFDVDKFGFVEVEV
jgi:adenine deaminase